MPSPWQPETCTLDRSFRQLAGDWAPIYALWHRDGTYHARRLYGHSEQVTAATPAALDDALEADVRLYLRGKGGRSMADPYDPQQAVAELDANFGDAYDIAFAEGRYIARRIDGTGQTLTADAPEDLDAAITADREASGDDLDQAVIRAYQGRGIEILHVGFWQAVIGEPNGEMIVTRDELPALLDRLRELDNEGILPD